MTKEIKVLRICAKCVDACSIIFLDEDGNPAREDHDGYVPDYFPEKHYGDYIEFDIDVETGKILNWKKPTQKEMLRN